MIVTSIREAQKHAVEQIGRRSRQIEGLEQPGQAQELARYVVTALSNDADEDEEAAENVEEEAGRGRRGGESGHERRRIEIARV